MNTKLLAIALVSAAGFVSGVQAQQLGYTEGGAVYTTSAATGSASRAAVRADALAARQSGVQLQYTEATAQTGAPAAATPLSRSAVRADVQQATRSAAVVLPYHEASRL